MHVVLGKLLLKAAGMVAQIVSFGSHGIRGRKTSSSLSIQYEIILLAMLSDT